MKLYISCFFLNKKIYSCKPVNLIRLFTIINWKTWYILFLSTFTLRYKLYNLILDQVHIINIEGFLCSTLGHGIKGEIIGHNYFGTELITITYKKCIDSKMDILKSMGILSEMKELD